jgi:hypothetical protein
MLSVPFSAGVNERTLRNHKCTAQRFAHSHTVARDFVADHRNRLELFMRDRSSSLVVYFRSWNSRLFIAFVFKFQPSSSCHGTPSASSRLEPVT